MKFMWFHLMPYTELPEDFRDAHPSVWGFLRLFLAPGMGHCGGGPGPDTFDALGALDKWVTQRTAPDKIIASHLANGFADRTRPLCAYPLQARWNRSGSSDDAGSFTCKAVIHR